MFFLLKKSTKVLTIVAGWEDKLVVWKFWSPDSGIHITNVEGSMTMLETICTRNSTHLDTIKNLKKEVS